MFVKGLFQRVLNTEIRDDWVSYPFLKACLRVPILFKGLFKGFLLSF